FAGSGSSNIQDLLAKLASLFGLDRESSQGNESFQYTAPKQPRKIPQAGAPAVLFATAVQAFRYINEQYVKQGKLGAAVLGSHTTKEYKLLLYLSQQKQVAAAKIHVGFVFTVQPNNYCSFYDDQRQNWSLMFESDKTAVDFCKEICLAKANSSSSLDTVVVQDLSLGEGQGVENGDSLEVVYTGWLLQNHTIGQMFDSNQNKDKLLRLKIGAGKVIKGWEEGMLGMQKEGSRLIVIPPNLAYGSKGVPNRVPSDSTLIFEAELRRVKFSKDSGSDRTSASSRDSAAPSPAPSTAPSVQNATPEPPVQAAASGPGRPGEPLLRAKSNSLSEQLANPDATKAKLISRMAKMGQPMLPFMTEVAGHPESSDSELEPYSYTQTSATPSQLQPVGQVYPAQTVPYMGTGDVTSFLMTEARQHNTEIRLSVGKVADKVDQLASKIDDLQRQGSLSMGVPSMSMETSMIMHNIQRIVQENECLKKEVFEKSARIEEQNHKIGDLINQNQRYIEQSHQLLEQRNDSLKSSSDQNQARLLQAEQEKVRLTEDLALSASRVSQLQLDASAHQQKSVELQNKLGSALQDSERHLLCLCLSELKEVAERAQTQYRSEKQRCKEMELKVNTMEEELQDVKADKESLERALSERKKKWQAERRRRDEEVEELRKNSQQELDNFRAQLRKARSSSDNARNLLNCTAMENYTLNLIKRYSYHLPKEWKRKCDHMLASAKEQHRGELAELTEQRDDLQDKLAQLQEKVDKLQSRDSEEQSLQQHCNQSEELQALQEKVKRVMNGVYHSLRGEFDLSESYSGQAVLGVIVSTIKVSEEKEEESEAVKQSEEKPLQNVHVNGKKEAKQEENEDGENVADSGSLRVGEIQVDQSAATEKEAETVTESKTQSQAEASQATDLHSVSTTALQPQETAAAAESEVQHEQGQPSATETYEGNESTHPDDGPDTSLPPEDGQEAVSDSKAAVSTEVDPERAPVDEPNDAPQKAFGPPANPPPPPNMLQNNSGEDTR
uniref:peptidylprolyl isomerase n=1 Tax=Amphiprion ocellaris TaxID=80972 RepID=A0AAQ5ZGV5_AMPOC